MLTQMENGMLAQMQNAKLGYDWDEAQSVGAIHESPERTKIIYRTYFINHPFLQWYDGRFVNRPYRFIPFCILHLRQHCVSTISHFVNNYFLFCVIVSFFGNTNTTAQSANAKCKRQNAELGDGANEEPTVGDDGLACGLGHLGV